MPDVVAFADTQAEAKSTLDTMRYMIDRLKAAKVPFIRVTAGNLMDWRKNGTLHTPLHFVHNAMTAARANRKKVSGDKMVRVGDNGILRRTCSSRFKIEPIRALAKELGATRHDPAIMSIGITLDEAAERMADSKVLYVKHDYPLVDLLMTGASCEKFLADRSIEVKKSACVMCPLASLGRINKKDIDDRDMAVAYDRDIRNAIPDHPPLYVDRDMKPLKLDAPEEPFDLFGTCATNYC